MLSAHAHLELNKPKTQLNISSHSAAAGQAVTRSVSYLDTFMKITEEQSELVHRSGLWYRANAIFQWLDKNAING